MKDHHLQRYFFLAFFLPFLTNACNIWKASDCPRPPTAEDEEIFKDDLYTREQLFRFCDQGKKYVDCVNKRLHCCDLKSEHAGALAAFELSLQQSGWRLGKYCSGLGASTIIQYQCKTTVSPARTTTTRSPTTSTIPPCEVEEAGKQCNEMLDGRLSFDIYWSVHEKIQWCQAARDYIQCADQYITNCSIIEVRDDVEQLSTFMENLMKNADLYCHGGFKGCAKALTDFRCTQDVYQFYRTQATESAASNTRLLNGYFFLFSFSMSLMLIQTTWL